MSDEFDESMLVLPYEYPYGDLIDDALREIDRISCYYVDCGLPTYDKRQMIKIRAVLEGLVAGKPE